MVYVLSEHFVAADEEVECVGEDRDDLMRLRPPCNVSRDRTARVLRSDGQNAVLILPLHALRQRARVEVGVGIADRCLLRQFVRQQGSDLVL
jgi:hypothetical protein